MYVDSIWQFPVKGLGGSKKDSTSLKVNQNLPGDRCYALSAGSIKAANSKDGVWLPKAHFLQLMKTEELAALSCNFDGKNIEVRKQNLPIFYGNLEDTTDASKFEAFIANFLILDKTTPPRLHRIGAHAYTDQPEPLISIGGTASLKAFASVTHTGVDARRFRLNIILKTKTPFVENEFIGKKLQLGDAVVEIIDNVGRCAAINVNPETARREPDHLATMRKKFGHSDLGVFGRVKISGTLRIGDAVNQLV